MKQHIYVFSIGEATTELCTWALERYGFEPILWQDKSQLWEKLKRFYAEPGDTLGRIDADIIPNEQSGKFFAEVGFRKTWWWQTMGWDFLSNTLRPISFSLMHRKAIDIAKAHIDEAKNELRPETYIWRLPDFHNPRVCRVNDFVTGIHGFGQKDDDFYRVRAMKIARDQEQNYDWKLVDKMRSL